jgi:hypothetical protein
MTSVCTVAKQAGIVIIRGSTKRPCIHPSHYPPLPSKKILHQSSKIPKKNPLCPPVFGIAYSEKFATVSPYLVYQKYHKINIIYYNITLYAVAFTSIIEELQKIFKKK